MLSGRYISAMIGLVASIIMLPAMEDMLKVVQLAFVILISVVINLFFYWGALKKQFVREIYPDFLSQLYKSDDFVQFLIDRQKKKGKHESSS